MAHTTGVITAEVQHRFAEFPYLTQDTDGSEYDDEAARFRAWLKEHDREVAQRAWERGVTDLAFYLNTDRRKAKPEYPKNPFTEKSR